MADVSVPRARNICLDCHTSFTLRYFDAVKARCERTHRSVANIREYSHDSRIFARFAQCRVKIDAFRAPPMEWWLPHHAHICRQGLQCFGATSQTIMCHQHPASPSRKRFAIRTCIRSLIGVYIESIHMVFKPSTDNHTTCTLWQHPAVPGTQVSGSSTLHCSLGVSGATIRSRRVSPKVTPYTGSLPERLSTLLTSCVSLDLAPTMVLRVQAH